MQTVLIDKNRVIIEMNAVHVNKVIQFLVDAQISFSVSHIALPLNEKGAIQIPKIETPVISTKIEKIQEFYESNIAKVSSVLLPNIDEIAQQLGMTSTTFKNTYKQVYGSSFYQDYMGKRMEHAAKLLKQGYKANEVTQMVGYGKGSAIKFNRMFQKHFGITPKKYQMAYYGSLNSRLNKTARQQR
jgi:AraC-like DNA-binding protein